MFNKLFIAMHDETFLWAHDFWASIFDAAHWSDVTVLLAVLATLLTSTIFIYRMVTYKNKRFLDWMILFREFGWWAVAFRFVTGVGLDWDWSNWSWILWGYIAVVTSLALLASTQERLKFKFINRGPKWRMQRQRKQGAKNEKA